MPIGLLKVVHADEENLKQMTNNPNPDADRKQYQGCESCDIGMRAIWNMNYHYLILNSMKTF